MKKAISVLLVGLLLFLAGCSAEPEATHKNYGWVEEGGMLAEQRTIQDYNEYIEKYKDELPADFVYYEDISVLGEFDGFFPGFAKRYADDVYAYGRYFLKEENQLWGSSLSLSIVPIAKNNTLSANDTVHKVIPVSKDMTSMRNAPCTERSMIIRNELTYIYVSTGKLSKIVWSSNGIRFELGGFISDVSDAKLPSMVKHLISIDEAEASAAFEEIKQSLNAK